MTKNMQAALHVMKNSPRIEPFIPQFVSLHADHIRGLQFLRLAGPWSPSEKFMLGLALHLHNPKHKIDLSGMDMLDAYHRQIAIQGIEIRYGGRNL